MRRLSPIEQMIDAACGVDAEKTPEAIKDTVLLVCVQCKDTLVVERIPEFFDYKEVETFCPKCSPMVDDGRENQ